MRKNVTVGLIGDYNQTVPAHQAIPLALQHAADSLRIEVGFEWVSTDEVTSAARISSFDGLWCVPASPYRSMDGALLAIRHARESAVPFLGTCGGFQHAVVEHKGAITEGHCALRELQSRFCSMLKTFSYVLCSTLWRQRVKTG